MFFYLKEWGRGDRTATFYFPWCNHHIATVTCRCADDNGLRELFHKFLGAKKMVDGLRRQKRNYTLVTQELPSYSLRWIAAKQWVIVQLNYEHVTEYHEVERRENMTIDWFRKRAEWNQIDSTLFEMWSKHKLAVNKLALTNLN